MDRGCFVHKIPVEYGLVQVRPKVLDHLGLDTVTKEVAVQLLDRYRLSLLHASEFSDEDGVYIIFTNEALMAAVPCGKKKCVAAKKTLKALGIISQKKQGMNRPNKIYMTLNCLRQLCEVHHTALDGAEQIFREAPKGTARKGQKRAANKKNMIKNDPTKNERKRNGYQEARHDRAAVTDLSIPWDVVFYIPLADAVHFGLVSRCEA